MLPARSDLLWGWGGGRGAGQAAHPHHSQAGPTPSCILRLTWAIPGPGPTRLHWPLENPGVRPLQVDSRSQAPRHGCPRTGALGRTLAASFPQPCPPPTPALAELQRPLLGAPPPPLLPTRGHSSSPQRAVTVDITCTTRGCQCRSKCSSGPRTLRPGEVASRIGILCPPGDLPARCEVRLQGVGAQ